MEEEENSVNNEPLFLGVKVSYFNTFITKCGGRAALEKKTTKEVYNEFIASNNEDSVCQLLDHVDSNELGSANWYISHCWDDTFLDLYDSLVVAFANMPDDVVQEPVVWIDIFSLSPSQRNSPLTEDYLQKNVIDAIKSIGNFIFVTLPWE